MYMFGEQILILTLDPVQTSFLECLALGSARQILVMTHNCGNRLLLLFANIVRAVKKAQENTWETQHRSRKSHVH